MMTRKNHGLTPVCRIFGRLLAGSILLALLVASLLPLYAQESVSYTVERYVNANFPVGMAFAPDGRLFYAEKFNGRVRVISPEGVLQSEPVLQLPTSGPGERGMLGVAIDPQYEENGYIWVVHTANTSPPANNLVRFREDGGIGYDPEVMLSVPILTESYIHNGGNVHFDSDGLLYLSLGDYDDPTNAQNLETLPGKIHRFQVTDEGLKPAPDNPFPDNSIYAYGFRNPFDFTIDPFSGRVFATENGPTCDDEINLVLPGMNYGWQPDYECVGTEPLDLPDYVAPLLSYDLSVAPTGIVVYDHPAVPEWQGHLFFCVWNSGTMRRLVLNDDRTQIDAVHEVDLGDALCQIDIVVGPEGALYFGTANEIYRLLPSGADT
jgi:aldose sugar dehydrogenase